MHPLLRLVVSLPPHLLLVFVLPATVIVVSLASSLVLAVALRLAALNLRARNTTRRRIVLASAGIHEHSDAAVPRRTLVGFFHPYCNAGGGGERVLWAAVKALQDAEGQKIAIMIYTGDVEPTEAGHTATEGMVARVQDRFGITLDPSTIMLVSIRRRRRLVEASTWPRFTLLGQSLGSIALAWEGLTAGCVPDVWIDTMGYAFAYPLVKHVCKVPVGSYTHYPTISTDMLQRVHDRQAGHTNTALVASSAVLSYGKYVYYLIFAELYSLCLRQADVLIVNSTWTKRHIDRLLRPFGYRDDEEEEAESDITKDVRERALDASEVEIEATEDQRGEQGLRRRQINSEDGKLEAEYEAPGNTDTPSSTTSVRAKPSINAAVRSTPIPRKRFRTAQTVYPPCDTLALSKLPLTEARERGLILSLAQFRPEKEHATQLKAIKLLLNEHPEYRQRVKLVMAGSVRDAGDEKRVADLRALTNELGIQESVEFAINVPHTSLDSLFRRASIGLHTMVDEHFGITIVEFMAAGLLPLVHASAGPLLDIVTPFEGRPTGFHATTAESFAAQLGAMLELEENEAAAVEGMRGRARRAAVERFGEEQFRDGWMAAWRELEDMRQAQAGRQKT